MSTNSEATLRAKCVSFAAFIWGSAWQHLGYASPEDFFDSMPDESRQRIEDFVRTPFPRVGPKLPGKCPRCGQDVHVPGEELSEAQQIEASLEEARLNGGIT